MKLKPCKCGAETNHIAAHVYFHEERCHIKCKKCEKKTKVCKTYDEAAEAWNGVENENKNNHG